MSVQVIDTLKPKNNGAFPVAEAVDIAVTSEQRLPEALAEKADLSALAETNAAVNSKANASDVATATANLQGQINQIEISASAEAVVAPEVAAARVGDDGTEYSTLKERLDTENTERITDITSINNTLDQNYLNILSSDGNIENGGFSSADGKRADNKRIRPIPPFFCKKGTVIYFDIGDLYFLVFELSSSSTSGGNVITSSGWTNATTYTVQNDCYIMITIANGSTYDTSTDITVNDFTGYSFYTEPIVKLIESDVSDIGVVLNESNVSPVNSNGNIENGGFSSADGKHENPKRIRTKSPIFCKKGTVIYFDIGDLYFLVFELSSSSTSGGNVIVTTPWSNALTYTVRNDCFVMIAFATSNTETGSQAITVNDFEGKSFYTKGSVDDIKKDISVINTNLFEISKKELYQGEYEQGGYSTSAPTESTMRIHMKDCVALPYGDKTEIHVKFDDERYLFAVRAGRTAQNLSSNLYWFKSGDKVTFNDHEQYYRIIWGKRDVGHDGYANLTPADLSIIKPQITYTFKNNILINDMTNDEAFEYLVNAENILSSSSHGGIDTMPLIFHGSDYHGDRERVKKSLLYAENYNADAIVFSGDMVANKPSDGCEWLHELFSNFNGKPILCTGNHDVDNSSYTDEEVYNYYMAPSAEKIGNANEKTYYYTDIPSKSIRIIVTDIYQYGATTRSNAHMTSEQLAYICNALKTAPSGYGIIIVSHSPCVDVGSLLSQDYSTFFQSLRKYGFSHYDISGTPIYDIIDAFNARGQIDRTYSQTGSPSSLRVADDFSNVDISVEFIAHLTGHIHEDSVCYLPTQTKQLMLNVCCGVAMTGGANYPYLADDCDTTRVPFGKTENALNAYVIDRTNKLVKIVRIGGTLTYDMKHREYMAIPYKDLL
ncbi:MAG: metallophosphoesterase [Ruminococcus sp.]|nr:metallophosphoesterase [Ruminococcus sp.]